MSRHIPRAETIVTLLALTAVLTAAWTLASVQSWGIKLGTFGAIIAGIVSAIAVIAALTIALRSFPIGTGATGPDPTDDPKPEESDSQTGDIQNHPPGRIGSTGGLKPDERSSPDTDPVAVDDDAWSTDSTGQPEGNPTAVDSDSASKPSADTATRAEEPTASSDEQYTDQSADMQQPSPSLGEVPAHHRDRDHRHEWSDDDGTSTAEDGNQSSHAERRQSRSSEIDSEGVDHDSRSDTTVGSEESMTHPREQHTDQSALSVEEEASGRCDQNRSDELVGDDTAEDRSLFSRSEKYQSSEVECDAADTESSSSQGQDEDDHSDAQPTKEFNEHSVQRYGDRKPF